MTLDKCNQREVAKVSKLISKILKITQNCKSDTQKDKCQGIYSPKVKMAKDQILV